MKTKHYSFIISPQHGHMILHTRTRLGDSHIKKLLIENSDIGKYCVVEGITSFSVPSVYTIVFSVGLLFMNKIDIAKMQTSIKNILNLNKEVDLDWIEEAFNMNYSDHKIDNGLKSLNDLKKPKRKYAKRKIIKKD